MDSIHTSPSVSFDLERGILYVDSAYTDIPVNLLPLFTLLWDNQGSVILVENIIEWVKKETGRNPNRTSISSDITSLRRILGDIGLRDVLRTVTGKGYCLEKLVVATVQ